MAQPLRWGILGAGSIARALAHAVHAAPGSSLAAVASRSGGKAEAFIAAEGAACAGARPLEGYDALLADDGVDIVYVATPHANHAEWTVKALEAGKHVLCEKPAALNYAQAMVMVEAARANRRFFMEAFMYRCHPQTDEIVRLLRAGKIGRPVLIQGTFGWPAPKDPALRFYGADLAGGGILDVGLYPVSFARAVAGAVKGLRFADPETVQGSGQISTSGIDDHAAAVLGFDGGLTAMIATAFDSLLENTVTVYGTAGRLHVPMPWHAAGLTGGETQLSFVGHDGTREQIAVSAGKGLYVYEVEAVEAALAKGALECEAMAWADTLGNMRTLDRWRAAIGLQYPEERFPRMMPVLAGRRLKRPAAAAMGRVAGLEKPVGRLVMGCDNQTTTAFSAAMFDNFFERGGNCFDTAHLYGGGIMEKMLGLWMKDRGVRAQTVVIGKGAHTPDCRPDAVGPQLDQTLDRLQTDHLDIYFLHRDDPAVPIGEWVDVLNAERARGRIGLFGGSNWTLERVREANDYARAKGLHGFTVLSNNFSLARMVNPVWPGVMACSQPGYRTFLADSGITLFPWSSQARGFFTDRAGEDKREDAELVHAWYSQANFARRARAYELAAKKGVTPTAIAAAYVLNQPFATFPLIGPRTIEETRTSFAALDIVLSEGERTWLEGDLDIA